MIPDKLYVEISGNKDSSVYWIGRTSSVPQSDDSVEYIRKDALLEWAKETYLNENASAIRKVCYKQLVDKIESL